MATGVGMTGAAMANMASHASGDDEVEVVDNDETSADHPAEAPQEISGMTKHGEEQAQGRDGHGVSDEAIHDAVDNPVSTPKEQPGEKFKYTGNDAIVVLKRTVK